MDDSQAREIAALPECRNDEIERLRAFISIVTDGWTESDAWDHFGGQAFPDAWEIVEEIRAERPWTDPDAATGCADDQIWKDASADDLRHAADSLSSADAIPKGKDLMNFDVERCRTDNRTKSDRWRRVALEQACNEIERLNEALEIALAESMAMREVLAPFAYFARPAAVEIAGGDEDRIAAAVAQHEHQTITLGAFLFAREVWHELSQIAHKSEGKN